MSRTFRVNVIYSRGKDRKQAICADGKQRWKCKCSYCVSNSLIRTNKELDRLNIKYDITLGKPETDESLDYWIKHSYDYWNDDYEVYEWYFG